MANIIEVDDIHAPGTSVFCGMRDGALRKAGGSDGGIFIAESPKVIERALDAGCVPVSLLTAKKHIEGDARQVIERCGSIPVYTANDEVLKEIAGFAVTRGVFCAMKRPVLKSVQELCKNASRVAVLENLAEATNVGSIFRSAAALGFDAVFVTPLCCDPLNRRAVRVSMGTVFQVPWTRIACFPQQWPRDGLCQLKSLGFKTAALALTDNSIGMDNTALLSEEKLAVILGTEGDGLLPQTIAGCDYTVKIPMAHSVDSLNVSAAAAVAFWQLRKFRVDE
ncbi:TrmH family RNA methyltransferase [Treponema sp.]|uniref:TrmH family RNA methyltransferase n=1 Tax=Treponema sp. TaxID=166 RepID=UPI003FD8A31B